MKSKQISIQKDWYTEPGIAQVGRSPVEEGKRLVFQEDSINGFSMIRAYTPEKLRRIGRYAQKRLGGRRL